MNDIFGGQLKLIVFRHGESEGNINPAVYREKSNWDISLTRLGRQQMTSLGDAVREDIRQTAWHDLPHTGTTIFPTESHSLFLSSPYFRTTESATIVGRMLFPYFSPATVRRELLASEISWGDAEGCSSMEEYIRTAPVRAGYNKHDEPLFRTTLGHLRYKPTRGETRLEVYIRTGLLLEKFQWFAGRRLVIIAGHKEFNTMLHAYMTGEFPANDEPYWPNAMAKIYNVNYTTREVVFVRTIETGIQRSSSSLLCEHANECPATCNCPADCYCKSHTCRSR